MALLAGGAGAAEIKAPPFGGGGQRYSDFLSTESGAVLVPAGIGLVSQSGYEAHGTAAEVRLLDRRLNMSVANTEGPVSSEPGAAADPLMAFSRQRMIGISGVPRPSQAESLTFTGTLVEVDRSLIDTGTGEPLDHERNRVAGGGVSFGAFDNRIRSVIEAAVSQNTSPAAGASGPEERADGAWSARLDADLLRWSDGTLSMWGNRRIVEPQYFATFGDAPANRDETGFGGHAALGPVTVELSRVEFLDNVDRERDILTRHDSTVYAALGLDLSRFRPASLVPRTVRLAVSRQDIVGMPELSDGTFAAETVPDETRSTTSIVADWPLASWQFAEMTLNMIVTSSTADFRQSGMVDSTTEDTTVNVTHTLNRGGWSGTMSASVVHGTRTATARRTRVRRYGLSASASTTTLSAPLSLRMNLLHSRFDGIDSEAENDIDTIWEVTAGGTLNGLLGAGAIEKMPPITGYVRVVGNDPEPTDSGIRAVEVTAGLKTRFEF